MRCGFEEEKIGAYLVFPPEPQELRARKIGHVIFSTRDDRPWSQYFCCSVAGNREYAAPATGGVATFSAPPALCAERHAARCTSTLRRECAASRAGHCSGVSASHFPCP